MSALQKLQNWYIQNCNGDWEHDNQVKIETLGNPGWSIEIDLLNTALENTKFNFNEEKSELDWYVIKVENQKFIAYCDSTKLEFMLTYFLEEFVPTFENKDFEYEVLLPLEGISKKVWLTDSIAKKVDENTFQIISIAEFNNGNLVTENFEDIKNPKCDIINLKLSDNVGDLIQTTLISTFQGTRLAKI